MPATSSAARSSLLNGIGRPAAAPSQLRGETLPQPQPRWLIDAIAASVHAERGRVEAIAIALGVPKDAVYKVADPNSPRASLKAFWIPTIVRETGSLAILTALAQQCDCVVVQLPTVTNDAHAAVVARAGKAMLETGEVVTEVGQSLADGRLTTEERARIKKQIAEAHVALVALELTVENAA